MNSKDVDAVTLDVIENYQNHVNPTQVALLKIGGFDHIEAFAEGAVITDLEGNSYIDCLGGYGVFSLGHRHPKVVTAVKDQLDRMPLASKTFLNKPLADLCRRLSEVLPGNLPYSFICNSGTEAVEGALKVARIATGKTDVIAANGGFHGKTMGSLSATGRDVFRLPFEPLVPGFTHVPWNDSRAIADAITPQTAAVILEPVQGEGGIQLPSPEYLPEVAQLCREKGILFILDEVQTGLGRTGKMFACEHWGVVPDIITLAKALGGGVMPVGSFSAGEAVWNSVFRANPFIHSSTFGGGELACAAALAAINATIEEGLPQQAAVKGARFLTGLQEVQERFPALILDARGLGLMLGLEFTDPDVGKIVIGTLVHQGIVAAYTLNNPSVIRFEPPLVITDDQIDQVLKAVHIGVAEAAALLDGLD